MSSLEGWLSFARRPPAAAGKREEILGLDTPGVARGYLSFAPLGLRSGLTKKAKPRPVSATADRSS